MKWRDFLEEWGLSNLKIKLGFLEGEFTPADPDRNAAWELYVELLTRVTTQYLAPEEGDEQAALDSVHELFPLTREIMRKHGSGATEFSKLAIPVLNQLIRPFTTKWHKIALEKGFYDGQKRSQFRDELLKVQNSLRRYTRALAAMAQVEDLTDLENT